MQLQRRSMLVTGAVLGVGPALAEAAPGLGEQRSGRVGAVLPIVMRQAHLPASVAFAAAGARPHQPLKVDLVADLGAALYGPQASSWRDAGRPLYGLARADAWFCLAQAAADAGLRAVRLQRHEPSLSLEDAAAAGREMRALARDSAAWRPALQLPITVPSDALVSWLLVPRDALVRAA
jgi:hypothetical protein